MTQDTSHPHELVSALADGQLGDAAMVQALRLLDDDPQARASWQTYHWLGEVLRSPESACVAPGDALFLTRLRLRLQDADRRPQPSPASRPLPAYVAHSANDAIVRWRWTAMAASLAAVSVLIWHLSMVQTATDPQLAQGRAAAPLTITPVVLRDPYLDQLLAAHQQQGGTSALQMPAGFVRNATFERPAR